MRSTWIVTRCPPLQAGWLAAKGPLSRCVSFGYTAATMNDVGLQIRVQQELREEFLEACRAEDKPAA